MIKTIAEYKVKDKSSFENRVIPYIYGYGINFKKPVPRYKVNKQKYYYTITIQLVTDSLSQLVTALTGMLRYSNNCFLNKIDIRKSNIPHSLKSEKLNLERALFGIILKPSIMRNQKITKALIEYAMLNKCDFIKDDDASEYSFKEIKEIKRLVRGVPYFQKIINSNELFNNYAMVIPWVNGWQLLENVSKKVITMSHCAGLSPQISWYSHIIFSRLAGASLIIVPEPSFDKRFNITLGLKAATKKINRVNKARLIISGGVDLKKIKKILKFLPKEQHKYIGFSIGSWALNKLSNKKGMI